MNLINELKAVIKAILEDLAKAGDLPKGAPDAQFVVEPPRDPSHGDMATNVALVLAKSAGRKPRELAEEIAGRLNSRESITEADVAGPGFINLRLTPGFWRSLVPEILAAGTAYGDSDIGGKTPINVEFVSANPTGPLHIGHVRGAVFGDALANLLAKAGFKVTKEYYTNDAGSQIDTLARSAHYRYLQALGRVSKPMPEGLYPGDYLVPVGEKLADKFGEKYADASESDWLDIFRLEATAAMMDLVRADLASLGIHHDVFFSERSIHESGEIEKALDLMEEAGNLYVGVLEPPKGKVPEDWEPRPQTLFRATNFGDDVDRPIKKSDGSYTYFAADIAYHFDKIRRGFLNQIDVLGADHGGYVKRLKAVVSALTGGKGELDVRLCQMVRLTRGGSPVKMSKRAGSFVTLKDVVDEVGPDVIRFMMLTRRNDAQLDFDFDKVTEQSRENPVFYVQYAHARIRSVLRKAAELWAGEGLSDADLAKADMSMLDSPQELALIRLLSLWPQTVEGAATAHEPHRIAFYLYDLAAEFHTLWNRGNEDPAMRFLIDDDKALSLARLALIEATRLVIASGLQILGVTPVEEMH